MTTVLPTTTALALKAAASSAVSAMGSGTSSPTSRALSASSLSNATIAVRASSGLKMVSKW